MHLTQKKRGLIPVDLNQDKQTIEEIKKYYEAGHIELLTIRKNPVDIRKLNQLFNLDILSYQALYNNRQYQQTFVPESIRNGVIHDNTTFLILSRKVRKLLPFLRNAYYQTHLIDNMISSAYHFLNTNGISFIFTTAAPHEIETWILCRTAELMKIDVFIVSESIIPNFFQLRVGIWGAPLRRASPYILKKSEEEEIYHFIEKNNNDYQTALPEYEKERYRSNDRKISYHYVLRFFFKKNFIKGGLRAFTAWKGLKTYNRLSIKKLPKDTRYFIFFLHYQPEATTLPLGKAFVDQLYAIKTLAAALPDGHTLLVKEHPSTFTHTWAYDWRNAQFYEEMTHTSKVKLVDLGFDTFELVDKAALVITITGTVGIQALIRNKPILFLGETPYKHIGSSNIITSTEEIHSHLASSLKNDDMSLLMSAHIEQHEVIYITPAMMNNDNPLSSPLSIAYKTFLLKKLRQLN